MRIAWLTTGRGPGSYGALEYTLDAIDRGLPIEIAVVFINRDRGEAEATDRLIAMLESRGVPVETLSSVAFRKARGGKIGKPGEPLQPWRFEYDTEVAARLARYDFELGVMFGYMLIATEPLFGSFTFINDHPALPDGPIGTYQEVIAELMRTGAAESGCMMNLVTGDVDRGPAISFCRFAIRDAETAAYWDDFASEGPSAGPLAEIMETPLYALIRARGVTRERPFLVETLRAIAKGDLVVPPPEPAELTAAVEAEVARSTPRV
ncbi:MAG TPA: formyltransferase family protein [Tepidiformaceae bacterium]|nr:formyltransferase family protein [Tepidiformaceae bacterium]